MTDCLNCFEPEVRENITVEGCGRGKILCSRQPGSEKGKRKKERKGNG